jgi:biotin carboxyl carrier protein
VNERRNDGELGFQVGASVRPGPIRITRSLSVHGETLVRPGDRVEPGTAVLSMKTFPGRVLRTHVAGQLRVAPVDTEHTLVKRQDEAVVVGEIIARSSLFWTHRIARSEHEGTMAGVSPSLGVAYMREHIPTQLAEKVQIGVVAELRGDKLRFREYLRVKEGDKVEKGQIIATRKDGHQFMNVFSPVFGTVTNFVGLNGTVDIIPDRVASVVAAHIPGVVTAVRDGREVDVAGWGVVIDGLLGLGRESAGQLAVSSNSATPWRGGGEGWSGRVVVCGRVDDTSLREAMQLGVAGIVAGSARQADLCRVLGRDLGVIATGDEDIELVLVLTEGFGKSVMAPRTYSLLAAMAGRTASLSGTTHIRAGVIRPRVIVSLPAPEAVVADAPGPDGGVAAGGARVGLVEEATELRVGQRVRVLRGPQAGRAGSIAELVPRVRRIATGAEVLVAMVDLEADLSRAAGVAEVPQANLKPEEGQDGHA